MLATPAKFHYVFNLRDLSRIWLGMIGTQANVIISTDILMKLWKHEVTRVLADRFVNDFDKEWFETELLNLVGKEMGAEYQTMIEEQKYFVDFLRDAPEPTGEEVEDADMELPRIYEPVDNWKVLEER